MDFRDWIVINNSRYAWGGGAVSKGVRVISPESCLFNSCRILLFYPSSITCYTAFQKRGRAWKRNWINLI